MGTDGLGLTGFLIVSVKTAPLKQIRPAPKQVGGSVIKPSQQRIQPLCFLLAPPHMANPSSLPISVTNQEESLTKERAPRSIGIVYAS